MFSIDILCSSFSIFSNVWLLHLFDREHLFTSSKLSGGNIDKGLQCVLSQKSPLYHNVCYCILWHFTTWHCCFLLQIVIFRYCCYTNDKPSVIIIFYIKGFSWVVWGCFHVNYILWYNVIIFIQTSIQFMSCKKLWMTEMNSFLNWIYEIVSSWKTHGFISCIINLKPSTFNDCFTTT